MPVLPGVARHPARSSRRRAAVSFAACLASAVALGLAPAEVRADEPAAALVEEAHPEPTEQVEVRVGAYVLRVRGLDPKAGQLQVDMWLWFRWQGDSIRPHESFEIVNGTVDAKEAGELLDDLGWNYVSVRVQATVFHAFDMGRFPFDAHTIVLHLEDSTYEEHIVRYVADVEDTDLDPDVRLEGWKVSMPAPDVVTHTYHSNYGYQTLGANAAANYSRFNVRLRLERGEGAILFKLFWVSYLSVVLALLALRVRPTDLDARFGLGVGSVFAASANAFVVNEQLPETGALTLADQVNLLAVGCIFVSLFLSVASLRLEYRGRRDLSEKLDLAALLGLGVIYLTANVVVMTR